MKDSYSFDRDETGLKENYQRHAEAYHRIFSRCGLKFYQVESDPGMMGGACAHEFMAPSPAGEDTIALCEACGYAANTELAASIPPKQFLTADEENWTFEDVPTPEKRTVEEVSHFLKVKSRFFIKSLLLIGEEGPLLALVRGDQELHEKKLQKIIGSFRTAEKEEVKKILGVKAGFIGPQENKLRKVADTSLKEGIYISGANRDGYHTRGIKPQLHFSAEWRDIHLAQEGDGCSHCGAELRLEKAIEIGNIFQLGTKYSVPLKALYLDEEGEQKPIIMGSYGIGPARIAAAAVEQNNDIEGIIWPLPLAPYTAEIIPLNMRKEGVTAIADSMYHALWAEGIEVLMDDRDMRPGVKFKDGDLIGIPWQIIIGEKNLRDGFVELKSRRTKKTEKVRPDEVPARLREKFTEEA
jgi:prolyl-tRNA synthetase